MNKGLPSIKQIVQDGTMAALVKLRKGYMYWEVKVDKFGTYQFPIPLSDMGDATWERNIKSITLMKWIRKAIDANEFVHISEDEDDQEEGY